MKNSFLILIVTMFFTAACQPKITSHIDLSGTWNFALDSTDSGVTESWFASTLEDKITLPGSMAENNKGNEITLHTPWTASIWSDSSWFKRPEFEKYRQPGNIMVPFWLSPKKVYVGSAWYQREVEIPDGWIDQQIFLKLERCHWESRIWVDNNEVGMQNSLSTPHVYDLTQFLTPGKHLLSMRIDNSIKEINPGLDAHSISDNTQTNWNGVVGEMCLYTQPEVSVTNIKVFPNLAQKNALVKLSILNDGKAALTKEITIQAESYNTEQSHRAKTIVQVLTLNPGSNSTEIVLPMGDDFLPWDEFSPALYKLHVSIEGMKLAAQDITFGMREIKPVGTRFYMNGNPLFLRGTLECCIFPLTGYPPTDVEAWKRLLTQAQNHGLNHIRFHSWCPPEAAFIAADELGVYFQIENAAWANIGDGAPIDTFIYAESERVVNTYGNHPSFCLMAYGNEPHGKNMAQYLRAFVSYWKSKDGRRVYTSGAGWPELAENDYHNIPAPRIQHWNEGLKSIINATPPQTVFDFSSIIKSKAVPVVSHEIGQWCAFPNFNEIEKYKGALKPKNLELFREDLNDHHMAHQAQDFLLASGKLQALCYKADIEAALRTPGMAGFQLLDLHDFPGQGTALVGVLDAFWDEKGYISPDEFRQFCNKMVPLARMDKLVFSSSDTLNAAFELANFSGRVLEQAVVSWSIANGEGVMVNKGHLNAKDYAVGNAIKAGEIAESLHEYQCPAKYTLKLALEGTEYTNQWDFWVYPEALADNTGDVYITDKFDDKAIANLKNGGNVLLTVARNDLKAEKGGNIAIGFSSIFWNTSWTKNQPPHTLGILCDPGHPALAEFPTEFHSNWQWWDIMSHSGAMNIDDFPEDYTPIIQPIHTWFKNNKLALVIEANVLKGKLLMTSIDLTNGMEKRLPSRQLKHSFLTYMNGDNFKPSLEMNVEEVKAFLN